MTALADIILPPKLLSHFVHRCGNVSSKTCALQSWLRTLRTPAVTEYNVQLGETLEAAVNSFNSEHLSALLRPSGCRLPLGDS